MNIFERAKHSDYSRKEWSVIENEDANSSHVLIYLLLLLASIPAICSLIGFGFIGYNVLGVSAGTMSWGIN